MAGWTISLNFMGFGLTVAQQPEEQQWIQQSLSNEAGGGLRSKRRRGPSVFTRLMKRRGEPSGLSSRSHRQTVPKSAGWRRRTA